MPLSVFVHSDVPESTVRAVVLGTGPSRGSHGKHSTTITGTVACLELGATHGIRVAWVRQLPGVRDGNVEVSARKIAPAAHRRGEGSHRWGQGVPSRWEGIDGLCWVGTDHR